MQIEKGIYKTRDGREVIVDTVTEDHLFPFRGPTFKEDGTPTDIKQGWSSTGRWYAEDKDDGNDLVEFVRPLPEEEKAAAAAFNPPFFPEMQKVGEIAQSTGGASLRDIYAGLATIAILSHEKNLVCLGGHVALAIESMADDAFIMAEALLRARGK